VKILVLQVDPSVARLVAGLLSDEGYAVDICASGADALARADIGGYALLILDWTLPELDGLAVCIELRSRACTMPVLTLSARGETRERVLVLDAGADDFIAKPFDPDELVARVNALVRRSGGVTNLQRGPLILDRDRRKATVNGSPVALTAREFDLLVHLARRADSVVTRSDLLAKVFGILFEPGSNVVDVHVSRVREKLGELAWMIETVRGVGYRLRTDDEK
jgi:DNA-binding response OmpR family regulator